MTKKVRPVPTLSYNRVYARTLLSKCSYIWVFLRRCIEIVTLRQSHNYRYGNDAMKTPVYEVTSTSNSKHYCSSFRRLYNCAVSRPYSSSVRSYISSSARLTVSSAAVLDIPISKTDTTLALQSARPILSLSAPLTVLPVAGLSVSCPLSAAQDPLFLHQQVSFLFN
jgi:hypothetical protein